MDYSASLDYLYGLQLFGIKLGLENMHALRVRLPVLQTPLPCIHVAGTNGKGSVSALLAEILKQSGLRVGLYTSPHLHSFTERVRINGIPIEEREVAALAEEIRQVTVGLPITFFEATTALALMAFQRHRVDIAVIETGLGGRLDATNIVEPQLCLITPISFDHSEHLGTTLKEIAAEKAGIIKPRVPVVVGKQSLDAEAVIRDTARSHRAELVTAGSDYRWRGNHDSLTVEVGEARIDGLNCALAGAHQLDNFAQAVAAAVQLRQQGFEITDDAIRRAGRTVVWPGRLEWLGEGRQVLFDVAHNQAGITCLAKYLEEQDLAGVHLVVGLSGERDPAEVLLPLVKFVDAVYAVPVSFNPSVAASRIVAWAGQNRLVASEYGWATDGILAAIRNAGPKTSVVVCGSLYLVAELRQFFLDKCN